LSLFFSIFFSQGQIEQHNKIIGKLADVEDSDEKSKMTETLEGKIMSLQFKLREVREKKEATRLASERAAGAAAAAAPALDPNSAEFVPGAEPVATSSVARFSSQRGRGAARGRGRFAGGRGEGGGRAGGRFGRGSGSMSLDCRPKALLVSNIPDGFTDVADQHFARFGKVVAVEGAGQSDSGAGLRVEFTSRHDAEKALKEGAGYGGSMLTLDWAPDATPSTSTGGDGGDNGDGDNGGDIVRSSNEAGESSVRVIDMHY
jgi:hypothetical protein